MPPPQQQPAQHPAQTPEPSSPDRQPVLRPATAEDVAAIASIWHRGWIDGHHGNVPEEVTNHRRLVDFESRVAVRWGEITVATVGGVVVGFVLPHDDEIEQIYVDEKARGGGVATALIERGERIIAEGFDRAWLAVVAGNSRARRFYERSGWVDAGAIDYDAYIEGGTFSIPCRRYEKDVLPVSAADRGASPADA